MLRTTNFFNHFRSCWERSKFTFVLFADVMCLSLRRAFYILKLTKSSNSNLVFMITKLFCRVFFVKFIFKFSRKCLWPFYKLCILLNFRFRLAQATKFCRPLTSMQLSSSWSSASCSESSSSEVRNSSSFQNDLETWFLPPTRTWLNKLRIEKKSETF